LTLACSGEDAPVASTTVQLWGTLRDVLRDGHTEGRVTLTDVVRPGSYGIGALTDLAGEITIDAGVAHVVELQDGKLVLRPAEPADQATLLVVAQVDAWDSVELPAASNLDELEDAILDKVRAAGLDPTAEPIPVRIKADFKELDLHVLTGSCPYAHPEGPPPWRLKGVAASGVMVGLYVEGRVGVLTHHGRRTHLHAIVRTSDGRSVEGHVEAASLKAGGQLQLPRFAPKAVRRRR